MRISCWCMLFAYIGIVFLFERNNCYAAYEKRLPRSSSKQGISGKSVLYVYITVDWSDQLVFTNTFGFITH